ncbi:MAG: COQ9 family protein [Paracoccaceae bacterium]
MSAVPPTDPTLSRLIDAALPHVAFDGWSDATFRAAVADADLTEARALTVAPRRAVDLAIGFHRRGDAAMRARIVGGELEGMRMREKIARAIEIRLEVIGDKEAVRRGTTLFALPHLAAEGAALIWGTADAIWDACGDTSEDANWYSKRAILSGVWSATVIFWLGDDSMGAQDTRRFVERRIEGVMAFEKAKAAANANPTFRALTAPARSLLSMVRAPARMPRVDLPGGWPGAGAGAAGEPAPKDA